MIESFLRYIEFEKRYSNHTLISYRNDLAQLEIFAKEDLQKNKIQDLDHNDLRSWVIFLAESEISSNSINRKIATLKSFYKFLLTREVIHKNPTERIKPLKKKKRLPQFVKEEEMMRLLDQVNFGEDFSGLRNQLILELLYGTGIRLTELINLKISQVSFFDSSIKVLGKRNKERVIPINQNLVKHIKEYLAKREGLKEKGLIDYMILTDKGEQTYPMMIYRVVKKYLNVVTSLDKKSPHIIRHTFATHLLNKGADLNSVKDLLGHTSLAATQVYTHNTLEKLKSVFEQAHPKA